MQIQSMTLTEYKTRFYLGTVKPDHDDILEILNHAASLEELEDLPEQLEALKTEKDDLLCEVDDLKAALLALQQKYDTLESELDAAELRLDDLQQQQPEPDFDINLDLLIEQQNNLMECFA